MARYAIFKPLATVVAVIILTSACSKKTEVSGGTHNPPPTSNNFNVTVTTIAGKVDDHGNGEDGNGPNARFWNPTKMVTTVAIKCSMLPTAPRSGASISKIM